MNDQPRPEQPLDDRLAEFTDRLLKSEEEQVENAIQDSELIELEQTVRRLKAAAQAARPDAAAAGRIRARVLKEWAQPASRSRQIWSWPRLAIAGVAAGLIFLVSVSLLDGLEQGNLTGAAGIIGSGENSWLWIPAVAIIGIILIIWLIKSSRN